MTPIQKYLMAKNPPNGRFEHQNRNVKFSNDNNPLREYFGTSDPQKAVHLHRSMEQLPKMQVFGIKSQISSRSSFRKEPVTASASNQRSDAQTLSLVKRSLDSDVNYNSPKAQQQKKISVLLKPTSVTNSS